MMPRGHELFLLSRGMAANNAQHSPSSNHGFTLGNKSSPHDYSGKTSGVPGPVAYSTFDTLKI